MAKSFLEAMEEALPLYGKSPVTGKAKARPASDPSEGDPDEEELLLAQLAEAERNKALAAQAGGGVADGAEGAAPIGNSSTETGVSEEDLYRITSGDEEVDDVSFDDLIGEESAKGMRAQMGGAAEGDAPSSDAMGNSSTGLEEDYGDPRDQILSGGEGYSEVEGGDFAKGATPQFDKSSLMDPTMGARKAGVPEEQLAALFKATHGGKFDPNSKTDRLKMMTIRDVITEDESTRGLSPAKFAMRVYARK